eukprot:13016877-Alexandrium_andersonii.AAC.1
MSASLVGSEMCIRDSLLIARNVHEGVAVALVEELHDAEVRQLLAHGDSEGVGHPNVDVLRELPEQRLAVIPRHALGEALH